MVAMSRECQEYVQPSVGPGWAPCRSPAAYIVRATSGQLEPRCKHHGELYGPDRRTPVDPEPAYRCNCGEEFSQHLARVVHAATCPTMQQAESAEGAEECAVITTRKGRVARARFTRPLSPEGQAAMEALIDAAYDRMAGPDAKPSPEAS